MFVRNLMGSFLALVAAALLSGQADAQVQYTSKTFSNDPYINSISFQSQFYGYNSGVNRPTTGSDNQPAYDYSVHLMYDQSLAKYRMYTGGRVRVLQPGFNSLAFGSGVAADGDHVLQSQSTTGLGGTWTMPMNNLPTSGVGTSSTNPQYWNGNDYNLAPNAWYANNSLEPEAAKCLASDGTGIFPFRR